MIFNSLQFAIFLPIVFAIYWLIPRSRLRAQNLFLIAASYLFYGWWDYRFLSLILISSIIDYTVGRRLFNTADQRQRKSLLLISLISNLGILGFFKYFNFFADSTVRLFNAIGWTADALTLNVILPVGISFYTFQTLSYTIDIYRKKIPATDDAIAFFAFVSFFPQLVAGPIERASNLLPQFHRQRKFDLNQARDGMRQILWGFIKKVVLADTVGVQVDYIFSGYEFQDGFTLLLGLFLFNFQVYGDFSGYSDIAIGTARLFGFNLMTNFSYPLFSRNIVEYWRRWHISLSTWFRDYLYFPLGGSRVPKFRQALNIITTFTVSGLWHGASWHFVAWGFINGVFFIPSIFLPKKTKTDSIVAENRFLPSFFDMLRILRTNLLISLSLVFLRSTTIDQAFGYLSRMGTDLGPSLLHPSLKPFLLLPLAHCALILCIEWLNRRQRHGLELSSRNLVLRWSVYFCGVIYFLMFGNFQERAFFYFQF